MSKDTRFIENKSLKVLLEKVPELMKELSDKHGPIEGLDRAYIILMQNDKNKKNFNMMIVYSDHSPTNP